MQLLIMQFLQISRHLISFWSKYSPQHSVLKTLSLCASLDVRDQVSHPYRTTGKIILFYIVIFMFLKTADEKPKGTGLNGRKHYLNSISP
jgi:hypothetical protein